MSSDEMTVQQALEELDRQYDGAQAIYKDESVPGLQRITAHRLMLKAAHLRGQVIEGAGLAPSKSE